MKLAFAIVLAGCARPAPPPVLASRAVDVPCDEAAWQQIASSPLRARVGDREVIVVEERRGMSRVAVQAFGAIFAGDVPDRRLGRVVTRETALWAAPGGDPLPGVVIEPGVATTGTGAWLEVHERGPIEVRGYVPAAATGPVWDAPPPLPETGRRLGFRGDVLAEPRSGAPQLAGIPGGNPIVESKDPGPPGWLKVTARDDHAQVTGWVAIPPPRPPSALQHTYDFSDDTIEGELVHPDATTLKQIAPGCLRAGPSVHTAVVGFATRPMAGGPAADGWLHRVIDTPWGRIDAYGGELPPEPPPAPEGSAAWWPTNDYWRER